MYGGRWRVGRMPNAARTARRHGLRAGADVFAVGTLGALETIEAAATQAAWNGGPIPISRTTIARVPSLFPRPSTLVSANGIQNGEGDVNHERISVPVVPALSQQVGTSLNHYESAWRTSNTGFRL